MEVLYSVYTWSHSWDSNPGPISLTHEPASNGVSQMVASLSNKYQEKSHTEIIDHILHKW